MLRPVVFLAVEPLRLVVERDVLRDVPVRDVPVRDVVDLERVVPVVDRARVVPDLPFVVPVDFARVVPERAVVERDREVPPVERAREVPDAERDRDVPDVDRDRDVPDVERVVEAFLVPLVPVVFFRVVVPLLLVVERDVLRDVPDRALDVPERAPVERDEPAPDRERLVLVLRGEAAARARDTPSSVMLSLPTSVSLGGVGENISPAPSVCSSLTSSSK